MTETLSGTFACPFIPSIGQDDFALYDQLPGLPLGAPSSRYTQGFVRVADIGVQPALPEKWSILGWSVAARVGYVQLLTGASPPRPWARWGTIWAGLSIDRRFTDVNGFALINNPAAGQVAGVALTPAGTGTVQLPGDLSTFAKVWTPDDPLKLLAATPGIPGVWPAGGVNDMLPVGLLNMLPIPVAAGNGASLQFVIIATPSLLPLSNDAGVSGLLLGLAIAQITYTVFYERQARQ